MSGVRFLWFAPLLALAFVILSGAAGPRRSGPAVFATTATDARDAGETYCPGRALVRGALRIPGGRCYLIAVLRDMRGSFLAFAPEDAHLSPGRLVRLDTPAGPKLKHRLFLVPLQTEITLVPANSLALVPTRIDESETRLTIMVLQTPSPNPPAVTIDEPER